MIIETSEHWHPNFRDLFVSLEFEWADNKVHPHRIHISLEYPERCPLSLQEIHEWAVDEAYKEMIEAYPPPAEEFSGAWSLPR